MITINCTNCQTELTMDEAFAGGVCRCQHCGTIQTVPKSARGGADASSGMVSQTASKALWRQTPTSESTPGTGLDDLADIVASSGLAGSGLTSKRLRKNSPPPDVSAGKKARMKLFGAIGGGVLAILILVIVLVVTRGGDKPEDNATGLGTPDVPSVPVISGPSFAGVKLDGSSTVIYVLDRGSGTSSVFSELKTITQKSIKSLSAERKFQIVFWEVRNDVISYPEIGVTVAGDISLGEAARKLEDISAYGSSTPGGALKKAAAAKPDTIIFATGKGEDYLDETFMQDVEANRPKGAKIYTFALGSDKAVGPLQSIASKSGGEYRTINERTLREMAK